MTGRRRRRGRAGRPGIETPSTRPAWIAAATGLLLSLPAAAQEAPGPTPPPEELGRAVEEVERLDELRSALAESFRHSRAEADRETFRSVCRPVGKQVKRVASENGWVIEQMAVRFRNPAHRPDSAAREVMEAMEEDRDLTGAWFAARRDGREGYRYFRRIVVEPACLACHGPEEERPTFVKERYPEDRAYGFEVGDLRGVYSVFVPKRR